MSSGPAAARPTDKRFWSAAEAAEELGITLGHLYDEKAAGRIGCDQRGRGCKLRFRREHLDAYAAGGDALADELASRRRTGTAPKPRRAVGT